MRPPFLSFLHVVSAVGIALASTANAQLPRPLQAGAEAGDVQRWCERYLHKAAATRHSTSLVASVNDLVVSAHPNYPARDTAARCDRTATAADAMQRSSKERKLLVDIGSEWREFERSLVEVQPRLAFAVSELDGAPDWFISSQPRSKTGDVLVGIGPADYFTFMRSVASASARKRMYFAYTNRGSEQNLSRLKRLADNRFALAKIRGVPAFYEVQAGSRDMPTIDAVDRFLGAIETQLKPVLEDDLRALQRQPADKLHRWDVAYRLERARERFIGVSDYDDSSLISTSVALRWARTYFSKLTGVVFSDATLQPWHESVRCYKVFDGSSSRGLFCVDVYPRAGKYYNYATFAVPPTAESEAVSVVLANFAKQLSPDEVERLFGEFAVALSVLMCGSDCAERLSALPVWAATARAFFNATAFSEESIEVLRTINAASVPDPRVLQAIRDNRHFAASLAISRQVQIARFDLDLHGTKPPRDVMEAWRTREQHTALGHEVGTRQPARLNTVAGPTAATLFVALWTEALATRTKSLAPCVLCETHKKDVLGMFFQRDGSPPVPIADGSRPADTALDLAEVTVGVARANRIAAQHTRGAAK